MNIFKRYKKEIVISLLTGIFLFYIQPILNFLGDNFVRFFIFVSDKFSNNYYTSVANDDSNTFADSTNFLFVFLIGVGLFYLIFENVKMKAELKIKVEKVLKTISETKNKLQRVSKEEKSKEEILKDLETLEESATNIKGSLFRKDKLLISSYILGFFALILLFTSYAFTKSVYNEDLNFRNNIIKIAPFVNDGEIKQIKANWASMKKKSDYEVIITRIKELKKTNKID